MKYSISVVIPNYNGKKLLENNLPSVIHALKVSRCDYEIIVADDASTDNSVSFLNEKFPQIKVLTAEKNSGFSATANRGIFAAQKQLTLLLNTDVKLSDDYLEKQFSYFEKPDTFGVMGSIFSPAGNLIDAAKYPQWSGFQVKSTLNFILQNRAENFWIPTYFLSGANALMDTKKLKQLNGFDEIFSPFYMEDVELSVRAWRIGWKCFYEPGSVCFHHISETIGKHHSPQKVRVISRRNKFIFHEIHLGKNKFYSQTKILFSLAFRWIFFDFDYYQSYSDFRKLKQKITFSKERFKSLKPRKNLEQVVSEIQKSVKGFDKKLF